MTKLYRFDLSGRIKAERIEEVLGFLKMTLGFRCEVKDEDIKVEEEK